MLALVQLSLVSNFSDVDRIPQDSAHVGLREGLSLMEVPAARVEGFTVVALLIRASRGLVHRLGFQIAPEDEAHDACFIVVRNEDTALLAAQVVPQDLTAVP